MPTNDELKLAFLYNEMNRFGYELKDFMVKTINEKDLYSKNMTTDHLRNRIGFKVFKEGSSSMKLQFFFADYGRFIEINYKKRGSRGKDTYGQTDIDSLISGKRAKVRKYGKDTRWYNITVYGSLNNLIGRVMWGFTEEAKNNLVQQFKM